PSLNSPVYVCCQDGLKEADKIERLPGQPNGVDLDRYSGYVTIRKLEKHKSPDAPANKPLVLWLNGGPSCSSFGNGTMMELGTFRVNSDGKTLIAWNNGKSPSLSLSLSLQVLWLELAKILFLESPAGVGFYYSNTSDYVLSADKRIAADSYTFMINRLERFPEYKNRDFFLTGDSYTGHYLAQLILRNNKITNQTIINLRGIAHSSLMKYMREVRKNAISPHKIWIAGLYIWVLASLTASMTFRPHYVHQITPTSLWYECLYQYNFTVIDPPSSYDPCTDSNVLNYLNTAAVQNALHANVTELPQVWDPCSILAALSYPGTVLPTIQELTANDIKVWMYRVPVTSTRHSINKLKPPTITSWYPWYTQDKVGGYTMGYQNLTFVTVRGAGHLVQSYQPARAHTLFTSFLERKLPPA
ncbi:LOW QUALITY PROTEIN: Peptidase S10, serine carboxypeptidase, partial [Dillenia turbinata]